MTIFTIGYEGMNIDNFLTMLQRQGVSTVVDIRQLPLSRKPGFSKKALQSALSNSGLAYVHLAALGCPKPVRDKYRADKSWKNYTEGFLNHLETQQDAIEELAALANTEKCALLCFEADHNFCHRSMVAHAVRDCSGTEVRHITKIGVKRENLGDHQLVPA
tara:strand:+ start:11963 stop:12445 length:483 start_codon:yes stop_codon:yes gene_type:complete